MAINLDKWSSSSKLAIRASASDKQIKVKAGAGTKFIVPSDDYFYATIRSHGKYEHIKVLAVKGDTLHVVRGQDNTEAQDWNEDSCIAVEWNPAQLCEYATQCVNGTKPSGVAAGTYCLDCTTCIEINNDGRISSIDGAKKCS